MIRLLFFILLISCGVRVQQDEVRSLVAPDNKILVIEEGKSVFKDIGEVLDSNQVARLSDIAIFNDTLRVSNDTLYITGQSNGFYIGGSANTVVLDTYTELRNYNGIATVAYITHPIYNGVFFRTTGLTENGGTNIVGNFHWERVFDGIRYHPEWWESISDAVDAEAYDQNGNPYTSKRTSTSGIYNDRDKIQAAIDVGGTNSTIVFGSYIDTFDIDVDVDTRPSSKIFEFNRVVFRRADSPVTTLTAPSSSSILSVADTTGFRAGQRLVILDVSNSIGKSTFYDGYGYDENTYNNLVIDSVGASSIYCQGAPPRTLPSGSKVMLRVNMFFTSTSGTSIFRGGEFDGNMSNGGHATKYPHDWRINKMLDTGTGSAYTTIQDGYFHHAPAENIFIASGLIFNCRADSLSGSFAHVSSITNKGVHVLKCKTNVTNIATDAQMDHSEGVIVNSNLAENLIIENCNFKNGSESIMTCDLTQVNTEGHYKIINSTFENFNEIFRALKSANPQPLREDNFQISGNTFIQCGDIYFWGYNSRQGLGVNQIKIHDNIFVDSRLDFTECSNLDVYNNQVLFDTARHTPFASRRLASSLLTTRPLHYAAVSFIKCNRINLSGNRIEGLQEINDTLAVAINLSADECVRLITPDGDTTNLYYEQDIAIDNNSINGFHTGITGVRGYKDNLLSLTEIFQTVGWRFTNNNIVLASDTTPVSSTKTWGIGAPPGALVQGNYIVQQIDESDQFGVLAFGPVHAGDSLHEKMIGSIIKDNIILGVSTGNDIQIGNTSTSFDYNVIVMGNIHIRGIGRNVASRNYVYGNTKVSTDILPALFRRENPVFNKFE